MKDEGLEFVSADRLMPGNDVRGRLLNYVVKGAENASVSVTLHPPDRGRARPDEWTEIFDARLAVLSGGWRGILSSQSAKITKLLHSYGEEFVTGEAFVQELQLSNLNIGVGSSDGLVFAPASPFESLNLYVSISHRNKVKSAHFEG